MPAQRAQPLSPLLNLRLTLDNVTSLATEPTDDAVELDTCKMKQLLAGLAKASLTSAEAFEVFNCLGALPMKDDIEGESQKRQARSMNCFCQVQTPFSPSAPLIQTAHRLSSLPSKEEAVPSMPDPSRQVATLMSQVIGVGSRFSVPPSQTFADQVLSAAYASNRAEACSSSRSSVFST